MASPQQLTFLRHPSRVSRGRLAFTIPLQVSHLLDPACLYEITVRAYAGTLVPHHGERKLSVR